MKRILSRMLVLCLCLCLSVASASAANVTVLPEVEDDYRWSVSMIPVGDTLYMMTVSGVQAQLHRWKMDMPEAETIATELYAERYGSIEELKKDIPNLPDVKHADAEHALSLIFTDGETLYGFNGLTNLVFAIDVTADGLRYTDVATLPRERVTSISQAISVQRLGKWVLWQEYDSESYHRSSRVLAYNLENGTVKEAVLPRLAEVTPYKDGLILAICKIDSADASYAVYSYNPNTDEIALLGQLPIGIKLKNAAYSAEMDLLVYQVGTRVMGWHPETGEEQLGFIPGRNAQRIAVMQGHVIYLEGGGEAISARGIERGYAPAHSLLVMDSNVSALGKAFSEKYPEVPYYCEIPATANYEESLTREKDAPDLLGIDSSDYEKLIGKGLLMDLSVYPEIKAYVDVLYPPYKELAMEGDAIYGVPVRAEAYNGWFINKKVMNDMGLKAEDIPTSLTELCAFANKWNNEFAEKYPHYTLLNNTTSYRESLLNAIISCWQDYCEFTGKPLTYDDPIFREAMAALDAASLDKLDAALKQTNPEISEYKQALIWTGCKTVGNWKTYMEDFSDRIFIPLTLTPETPYTCSVKGVGLWVVNASTKNAEYAAAMVTEAINVMDDVHAYVLRTDKTEPVLDDSAEKTLAVEREKLAALEAKLEESVNKAAIEKRIEEQKTYIEDRVIPSMYTIVPSALENYVKVIEPATFISEAKEITSLEHAAKLGCIERYLKGTYTVDEFINRMNELFAK